MSTGDLPLRRIDHVRFFVGNARQSAYFYRNAFGFDVSDPGAGRACHLRSRKGTSQRRVHVADDDHPISALSQDHRLERLQNARRLRRVTSGAGAEVVVRCRQLQLVEERVRHRRVVMLTRVDQDGVVPTGTRRPNYGRDLHEIGPRARGQDELQGR